MIGKALILRLWVLRARAYLLGLLRGGGLALALAGVIVLCAAWLDLLAEIPPTARAASVAVGAIVGLAGLLRSLDLARRLSRDEALAHTIDEACGSGGVVLSGIQLSKVPDREYGKAGAHPLSAGLGAIAIARAAEAARSVPGRRVLPLGPALRPLLWSAGLVFLVTLAARVWPDAVWTQFLRMSDPFGDHPPYSPTSFFVSPGNASVTYGDTLDITVRCEDAPPERLDLVAVSPGGEFERLPMFQEDEDDWRTQVQEVREPFTYFVKAPQGRSHRYAVAVTYVPRIEQVTFRITPPSYTGLGARRGPVPQGGLSGLSGTKVELTAQSNRPLRLGDMELRLHKSGTQKRGLLPVSEGSRSVRGEFEIRESGELALRLVDVDGRVSRESSECPIALLKDLRPVIRILQPRKKSLATPTASLPVVLEAEDDYGFSRLQLFRSLNHSRHLPRDLPLPPEHAKSLISNLTLPLSQYGLEPGDLITLFGRVVDNDPERGKGSETPPVEVQIISHEEFARMLQARQTLERMARKYHEADRLVENLRSSLERLRKSLKEALEKKDEKRAEALMRELAQLHAAFQAAKDALDRSLAEELHFDIDRALRLQLRKMRRQLEGLSKGLTEAAQKSPMMALPEIEGLCGEMQTLEEEYDREAMEPLQVIEEVYPVMEDAARFAALYLLQKDLAARLSSLKDRDQEDDPDLKARMRDLEDEQQALREGLELLLEDLKEDAARLPDEEPYDKLKSEALDFAKAVEESPIVKFMGEAEEALKEYSGSSADSAASEASEEMEKFVERCQVMNGAGGPAFDCLRFQPLLYSGLGDTIPQLMSAAGLGEGSRHGYAMMMHNMHNMGLYGDVSGEPKARGGTGDEQGTGVAPKARTVGRTDARVGRDAGVTFGGVPVKELPAQYRGAVRAYFERLAEELSGE